MSDYDTSAELPRAAAEIIAGFDPYCCGSTDRVVNAWKTKVQPFFDVAIAAVKDVSRPFPAAFIDVRVDGYSSPLFGFVNPKALGPVLHSYREMTSEKQLQLMSELFTPYLSRWDVLLEALAARYGRIAAIGEFKAHLRDYLALIRTVATVTSDSGMNFERLFTAYEGMCNAFAEIGPAIEAAVRQNGSRDDRRRGHYPKDEAALEVLRELKRRKGTPKYQGKTNVEIVRAYHEQGTSKDRIDDVNKWAKYLSEYINHPLR